jgi:Cupin-like domain
MKTKASVQYQPVDRRHNLSVREFKHEYLYRSRPVVVTDALDQWNARDCWTFEAFKSRYGKSKVDVYHGSSRPEMAQRIPLAEYIERILANDFGAYPYYLRYNFSLLQEHKELWADFAEPKYCFDWFRLLPKFMRLPSPRIYMGPKGAVSDLHQDRWGTHFWMAQLAGRKHWILFGPDQEEFLYGSVGNPGGLVPYQVNPDAPDLERFPMFAKAKGLECTIGPGDLLIVPSNWVHWVVSLDPTLSLTHNYMGHGNFRSCLKGQLSWTLKAATAALKARISRGGRTVPVRDLHRQKG